ncbi:hypothetical protein [Methanolobus sp. ZRKC5]|uniref:hypothetical protein n=1 Tax=unclassified Methanolobus TaxID=2629569 RepID=UPI00313C453A
MRYQKNACWIFALCLCIVFCGNVSADFPCFYNVSNATANYSVGVPVYEIYSDTKYIEKNVNEGIKINYFITGVGQVDTNKIRISIPSDISKEKSVSVYTIQANWSDIEQGKEKSQYETRSFKEGSQLAGALPAYYFTKDDDNLAPFFNYGGKPWQSFNNTSRVAPWQENGGQLVTPLSLEFQIADNANPGNYEVMCSMSMTMCGILHKKA